MKFSWDPQNIAHVAAHGVAVSVVEAVFDADDFAVRRVDSLRFVAHGTVSGKTYRVVAAFVGEDVVYVVSAFRVAKKRAK